MRIHPLTEEGHKASKTKLEALRAADEVRRETAHAKNDLESYILQVKHQNHSSYLYPEKLADIVKAKQINKDRPFL